MNKKITHWMLTLAMLATMTGAAQAEDTLQGRPIPHFIAGTGGEHILFPLAVDSSKVLIEVHYPGSSEERIGQYCALEILTSLPSRSANRSKIAALGKKLIMKIGIGFGRSANKTVAPTDRGTFLELPAGNAGTFVTFSSLETIDGRTFKETISQVVGEDTLVTLVPRLCRN